MIATKLVEKIQSGSARIATIGLGYVGLPLSIEFASSGLKVLGLDVDKNKLRAIREGESYLRDVSPERLRQLVNSDYLEVSDDFDRLSERDAIIICVPTPLSKTKDPDLSLVVRATREIAKRLRSGHIVVLESTTYPGTTEELILPILEREKLTVGKDFFLAFSPERVDPGNVEFAIRNTPKIIGGVTASCTEVAKALYKKAVDSVIPVSSTRTAEMVKLLENTFRSVNIGLVNEVALMCDRLEVDAWEVIDAAASKPFGFMPFYPGPGLGGHCIPIDPLYLSWKLKTLNYRARFIELAGEVNSEMPYHVVSLVRDTLNVESLSVKGSQILLVGVAYKPDVDDVRESPAIDLLRLLEQDGAQVKYHDPYVRELEIDGKTYQSQPLSEGTASSDCVVIVTNHSSLDIATLVEGAKLVVDTRNATRGIRSEKIRKL